MSSDSEDVDINYVTMHLVYALKPVTIHAEMCFRNIFHRISEWQSLRVEYQVIQVSITPFLNINLIATNIIILFLFAQGCKTTT